MVWFRRRPSIAPQTVRLLSAAGLSQRREADDQESVADILFAVAEAGSPRLAPVLAEIERMLGSAADYGAALQFLEGLQNLLTHRAPSLAVADDVAALLGPSSRVCWAFLDGFWDAVRSHAESDRGDGMTEMDVAGVQDERLRRVVWPMTRTLAPGLAIGLAEAVRYEADGGRPLPEYDQFRAVVDSLADG